MALEDEVLSADEEGGKKQKSDKRDGMQLCDALERYLRNPRVRWILWKPSGDSGSGSRSTSRCVA
jgi:hypothetical protein